MIDSGAALNLIHKELIKKYDIPTKPCNPSIKIKAIDDNTIVEGITHQTKPLTLQVGLFHQELISLYVVDSPKHEVIFGFPWLSIHDPIISWHHGELTNWSNFCENHCFSQVPQPCFTTSIENQRLTRLLIFPIIIMIWQKFLVKSKQCNYHLIAPGTVQLIYSPMPCPLKVKSTPCPKRRPKPWKNISKKH